jgi:hypothetical protein
MCESCERGGLGRREFLGASGALAATGLALGNAMGDAPAARETTSAAPRPKQPARVLAAFIYPPADMVNAGQFEDRWRAHRWFTWPGNQFQPEEQQQKFTAKIREMADRLGVLVEFISPPIHQSRQVQEFIERTKQENPDAVLVINFWNTTKDWALRMAQAAAAAIVYQPVGSSHQLPPEAFRNTPGLYFIHAVENWTELERGLRAVRAKKMLAQSRLIRVSGSVQLASEGREKLLGVEITSIPAREFNDLFDAISPDDALRREALEFKRGASRVTDVGDEYIVDAFRAHRAVAQLLARYAADAITIECLMLKHRKPCVSFAIHNGLLVPCGCENDLNATLTLMLGRWLLERAGFQHNPDFDTSENRYFGAHCTCAWRLHGPAGAAREYQVRPFFHQLPNTPALDVQWSPGEAVLLTKYLGGKDTLYCWTGKVVHSPAAPPTGGCATRVLVEIDGVRDVCEVYAGPHPVLFCGNRGDARVLRAFARLYRLGFQGNL